MAKNLVIVESPAKAKTIEGFLGKDFKVKSSMGHVRDLTKEKNGVDIENNFKPMYEVSPEKKDVVKELKKLADESEMVWLASDEDREGEAISWHLKEVLKLKPEKTKRIVFHEITKPAILKAIENPRSIDEHLVDAQQARRILDRLVGFELSPILWKKVKPSLSAGRVQSVAVRLIVEREREIKEFSSESFYKIAGIFEATVNGKKQSFKAELPERFSTVETALSTLEKLVPANFTVASLEKKPLTKNPEAGLISYMRTDSTNLSEDALNSAASAIRTDFGDKYSKRRVYKTKNQGAQEAHEAIRPTDFRLKSAGSDKDEQRLYELIWNWNER